MHLLHSFYDFNYVIKQPVNIVTRLLTKAKEKKFEQQAWERWLVDYRKMDDKSFISFKEYLEKLKAPPIQQTNETVEETYTRFKMKVKKM